MRHLKSYENIDEDTPKIGDYVICKDEALEKFTDENETLDFLANNIGQIQRYTTYEDNVLARFKYIITFDKMQKNVKHNFNMYKGKLGRAFSETEILHFSSNKEYLETILDQNKFNL